MRSTLNPSPSAQKTLVRAIPMADLRSHLGLSLDLMWGSPLCTSFRPRAVKQRFLSDAAVRSEIERREVINDAKRANPHLNHS